MLFWICSYREISAALSWTPPKCRATADGERALARGTRQHRPVSSPRQCTGSGPDRTSEVPAAVLARLQRLRPGCRPATRRRSGAGRLGESGQRTDSDSDLRDTRGSVGADSREEVIRLSRRQRSRLDPRDPLQGAGPAGAPDGASERILSEAPQCPLRYGY